MIFKDPNRYNFYKLENEIKKGKDKFIQYINNIFSVDGVEGALNALKSSGLSVNLFNSVKHRKLFNEALEHISTQVEEVDLKKIKGFKEEISHFEHVFSKFDQIRSDYFEKYETIENQYKVVSYLISLELYLRKITDKPYDTRKEKLVNNNEKSEFHNKVAFFDSAIESTGMILKYFKFKKYEFKGSKRNISPKNLEIASKHIVFSGYWDQLNDILEYWKYSDVEVSTQEDGKVLFEIVDKEFEMNNLVSNERFNNLRQGWQMSQIGEMQQKYFGQKDIPMDQIFDEVTEHLNFLFATLYFGSPSLSEKINGIEIKEWIRAYDLLVKESKKILRKRKQLKVYNLEKVCLSKSPNDWTRFFKSNGFNQEDSDIIIQFFTFDNQSMDLIDCPFVKVDDKLVILPSITSQADVSRALASNFLNRKVNLDFKGSLFEEKSKIGLEMSGIKSSGLYKKTNNTEYECDIAFVLDDELFFVECKAHVQPFTTRQHAGHLNKLFKETLQLNRIADFFESNLSIVVEQLNLEDNFIPKKVHRILLTTSMIGTPLFVNGVYIVDESAFTMFIDRSAPRLEYYEKGQSFHLPSRKFDIYEGVITGEKMIEFLISPPQIEVTKELYKQKDLVLGLFNVRRNIKANQTLHLGVNLNASERSLLEKYY